MTVVGAWPESICQVVRTMALPSMLLGWRGGRTLPSGTAEGPPERRCRRAGAERAKAGKAK